MGQPLILSLTAPFPDSSLCEGAEREGEWHLTQAANYFQQAECEPDDACYYNFWGMAHTLISIPYQIPLINCMIYVINYLAYAIFSPECMQDSQQEALNARNLDGAYLMVQRGVDRSITNDQRETLVDLYAKETDRVSRLRTYHLILENLPFNPQSDAILSTFQEATKENRRDVVIKLLEKGVEPRSWTVENSETPYLPPPSIVPRDLTHFIKETGKPCIARVAEKREVERIFLQRYHGHPLLIGPAGGGKTALANSIPNKHVLTVDLKLLQSASETQVASFKRFVLAHKDNSVLLLEDLDEVPEIYLLQFLSIFETIPRIGCARTDQDLSKYFTSCKVKEPTDEEVKQIAQAAFPSIEEATLTHAIRLCKRYLPNQALPQSLLTTLDRSQAFLKTQQAHGSLRRQQGEEIETQEQQERLLIQWEEKLRFLIDLEVAEDHPLRSESEQEIVRLATEIGEERVFFTEVTPALIQHILNPYVPPANIEAFFKARIFGQDHVIEGIIPAVSNAAHGLNSMKRAQGAFHFVGLTGTGKTEMGKAIAEYLNVNFIHVDMSKYREAHNDSTLVGAAAGYVGYEQGGLIQEEAKKGPMVLLLDEVDKADSRVLGNLLLHLLDEGEMLDPVSRQKINMHRVFVILASNLGSQAILDGMNPPSRYFSSAPKDCSDPDVVLELIRPDLEAFVHHQYELLARFQTLPFIPLKDEEATLQITRKFLQTENQFTQEIFGVTLEWTPAFIPSFTSLAKPKVGARPIRDHIEQDLRFKIAQACRNRTSNTLVLDYDDGDQLTFRMD